MSDLKKQIDKGASKIEILCLLLVSRSGKRYPHDEKRRGYYLTLSSHCPSSLPSSYVQLLCSFRAKLLKVKRIISRASHMLPLPSNAVFIWSFQLMPFLAGI
jgi:hypothetical protein